jgi:hypothetical protein
MSLYVGGRDAEWLDRTARGLFIFAGKDKARWWVDPRNDGDTDKETARLRISSIASMAAQFCTQNMNHDGTGYNPAREEGQDISSPLIHDSRRTSSTPACFACGANKIIQDWPASTQPHSQV